MHYKIVISSYYEDIETNLPLESIPCVYLHDILKRLPAKLCLDVSFRCLSRFVAFSVTLTSYDVAYCHAYISG